jgi:cytochrome c5
MWNRFGVGLAVGLLVLVCVNCFAAGRLEDGRIVYAEVCARCHDLGVDGAPVIGRTQDWSGRSNLWEAVLFKHAQQGYLGMPARGGQQDLSEYDVGVAAEYMLSISRPEFPED